MTHTPDTIQALLRVGETRLLAVHLFPIKVWRALLDAQLVRHEHGEPLSEEYLSYRQTAEFALTDAGKMEVARILKSDGEETATYFMARLEEKVNLWRERALKTNQAYKELRSQLENEKDARAALQVRLTEARHELEHVKGQRDQRRDQANELAALRGELEFVKGQRNTWEARTQAFEWQLQARHLEDLEQVKRNAEAAAREVDTTGAFFASKRQEELAAIDAEVRRRVTHLRDALRKTRGERDALAVKLSRIRQVVESKAGSDHR